MSEIKFGTGQFGKPIPAKTTRNLGISAFILSTMSSYMASASYIPADLSSALQGFTSFGATICLGLIPFFGVETSQKTVPIEEVASMETDDKKEVKP